MAYTDYTFDPTGSAVANLISQEIQGVDSTVTVAVFPEQGAFFADDFTLEGRLGGGTWVPLKEGYHFSFSPLFLSAGAKTTRQRVFTYVVLMAPSVIDVDEIRVTYQALGGYQDDVLLAEIASQVFDRTDPYAWLTISGQVQEFTPALRDPSFHGIHLTEVIASRLEQISAGIVNPYGDNRNYATEITALKVACAGLLSTDDLEDVQRTPETSKAVTSGATELAYTFPVGRVRCSIAIHFAVIGDGFDTVIVDIARGSSGNSTLEHSRINTDTNKFTLNYTNVGNEVLVSVTAVAAGTLKVKTIYEF